MTAIESAWIALTAAIAKARNLHERCAEPLVVADLVQHARELLDIIEAELTEHPVAIPSAAGAVLAQLRGRLQSLEHDVKKGAAPPH